MNRRNVGRGIGVFIFSAFVFFLIALIAQKLWNSLIPGLFNGPVLNYSQTIGLLVLAKIITWSGGGWRRKFEGAQWKNHHLDWKHKMDEKIAQMTPEQREKFMSGMKDKCRWYFDRKEERSQEHMEHS